MPITEQMKNETFDISQAVFIKELTVQSQSGSELYSIHSFTVSMCFSVTPVQWL